MIFYKIKNLVNTLLQVVFLLLAFFSFGEFSVFYFGSALYFSSGYFFSNKERAFNNILNFLISVTIFLIIIFSYFVFLKSTNDELSLPNYYGFAIYFLVFAVSFTIGRIIKVKVNNRNLQELLFFAVLSLLLMRASIFLGKPFFASFSGVVVFFFSYRLFLKGKIVVLDLWTTSCVVCFKKFPEFEKFYNNNKDRDDIEIYALNLPLKGQKLSEIVRIINNMEYDFPDAIAVKNYQHYHNIYNISGVPSIIVLNKKGKLVYNSSFNNNPLILVNNLQTIVDKLSNTPVD